MAHLQAANVRMARFLRGPTAWDVEGAERTERPTPAEWKEWVKRDAERYPFGAK